MPPRDPRLCPALERALPAGDVPGGEYRPVREPCLVMFGDGQWHQVTVRARRKDRLGRDIIDIEWHAAWSTWNESYVATPELMREPPGPDGP